MNFFTYLFSGYINIFPYFYLFLLFLNTFTNSPVDHAFCNNDDCIKCSWFSSAYIINARAHAPSRAMFMNWRASALLSSGETGSFVVWIWDPYHSLSLHCHESARSSKDNHTFYHEVALQIFALTFKHLNLNPLMYSLRSLWCGESSIIWII